MLASREWPADARPGFLFKAMETQSAQLKGTLGTASCPKQEDVKSKATQAIDKNVLIFIIEFAFVPFFVNVLEI